jgi:propanediol dehydratase large subunit
VLAGDSRSCFSVSLINDNIYKTGKSFYYSLGSRDHHVTIEGAPRGEVRIADNDEEAVIIGFEEATYTVVESESIEACVWLTGARIGQPLTVTVITAHTSTILQGQLHNMISLAIAITVVSGPRMSTAPG